MEKIAKYFEKYLPLDNSELQALTSRLTQRKIKRKQFILQEGNICKYFTYVVEGCFRMYSVENSFKIHFEGVKAIYSKDHDVDNEYLEQDGSTIDQIGFSHDSGKIMDGPTDTKTSNDLTSLIFVFVTGKAIKVTAETARLILN